MDVTDDIPVVMRREAGMTEIVTADLKPDQKPPTSLEPPLRDSAPSSNSILGSPSKIRPSSVIATKNTRKRMEDRHVVLHDLKAYLPSALQDKIESEEHVSYYAVFDGHAGTDAAAYAAAHLHEMVIDSSSYPHDPVQAFSDAFIKCDKDFIKKSKKSGSTAICSLIQGNMIFTAWLGDSQAVLVRDGAAVKIVEPHKPNRDDERARIEALGGAIMHWGTWRVNGQLAVSRAIGDGEYKPYISAEADITTVIKNGTEDFLIIACDGLWDTITPEEATDIVFQHLEENRLTGGDIENIGARLATASKDRGSGDNITIIVVFIRPVEELIARGRGQDGGQQSPDLEGVTSTSDYVFMSSRESLEPVRDTSDLASPNVSLSSFNLEGGAVFSPDPFNSIESPGAGFNFSSETFDNKIDDKSMSEEESFSAQQMEEMLKQESIAKVEDLFKILDREDCSPTPDEEDARPLEEILAAARLQPQDDVDGLVDDDDSSDDEIVDFGACDNFNAGSGNPQLEEVLKLDEASLTEEQNETDTFSEVEAGTRNTYQEPRMDPCEQVTVKETGPEEYSTIVPPVQEMPSQQQPVMELVDSMVCSVVREEQEEAHDVRTNGEVNGVQLNGEAESVSFEVKEDVGFMLKTPGQTGEEKLAEFSPEQEEKETSVDTGESVVPAGEVSLAIPNVKITPATPVKERSPAPAEKKPGEVKEAPEAKSSPKKTSAATKPRQGTRQVQPEARTVTATKTTVRQTPAARSAPSSRTTTTTTTTSTASRSRPNTGPTTGRSKVLEDRKSTKSGPTTGSERNSKSGTVDRQIPKTSSARPEKKPGVVPKPEEKKMTTSRPRTEQSKDVTKEPRTLASKRPTAATSKTPANISGNVSSASSASASSSRSRPALSRPSTVTTRTKPEDSPKKTGTGPRVTPARTASSATAGPRPSVTNRSTASATSSRAVKSTAPVKPTAAAERVAAARAAAMAKPANKLNKTKSTVLKKEEEKDKKVVKEASDQVPTTGEVNVNGNESDKIEAGVKPGEEIHMIGDNDIQNTVNGLSDANHSEC